MNRKSALLNKIYLNWRWLVIFLVVLVSAYTFVDLAGDVWLKEGFAWDIPIIQSIHQSSSPLLDLIFRGITFTAGPIGIVIAVVIGCLWLWKLNQKFQMMSLAFSVIGMALITSILKVIFQRPRPDIIPPLVAEASYSFPSGHTGSAVAFYGLLGYFLWQEQHYVAAALSWSWVILVMLSRIYLGAHYPSDVLASLALGIIWVLLLIFSNQRQASAISASSA